MKQAFDFLKSKPLVTGILGVGFIAMTIRFLGPRMNGDFEAGVFRLICALAGMVFLYLISGEKAFEKSCKTTGYVCLALFPTIVVPLIIGVTSIIDELRKGTPVRSDCLLQLLIIVFLYLCVGLVEEVIARGVINDSLLYQFRDTKHIFLIIAIADVLVFGAIHLIGSDMSTPMAIALGLLKTLSSGVGGLCYLFMYWKTRNLWGIAIMHGMFDFVTSISGAIFEQAAKSAENNYVNMQGQDAMGGIIVFAGTLVIDTAIAIWLWKFHMKDVDFEEIRETW